MVRLDRLTLQGFKSFAARTTIPFPEGFNIIAGPNGSGKCLDYNSIVLLESGEEVKIGDLVEAKLKKNKVVHIDDGVVAENETDEKILSLGKDLKFSPRRIKSFIRRKAPASMLRIRTRSGREIVTTKYHPFFSIKSEGIISLKAEEINEGVRIA